MQFTNYFFASLISFSGLFIGLMLVRIAPEEQKPLQNYFILAGKSLLLAIFVFLMFYYSNQLFYLSTLIGYFIFLIFVEYRVNDPYKKSMLAYAVLGALFFLSMKNTNLFAIEASLILLYGLPAASLLYSRKGKNHRLVLHNLIFLVISNLLFFTTSHPLF